MTAATTEAPATDLAISLRNLSKEYKLYASRSDFIAETLFGRRRFETRRVLSHIDLAIAQGEVVGVIGRNGAGKSTLLKLIAGTLPATEGTIAVNGRVSAILELGTGFNPAYSGRDNVIMSAMIRGMREKDVLARVDEIVAFAGLEDVIDQPFSTYSSGMQARLAFAAATSVMADVIIIDEALAAGDSRFAARSMRRVKDICKSGVTALFVSHQTYHVMQLCTRAIWIDDGRIRMDGPPLEVCRAYEYWMLELIAQDEGRTVVAPAREHTGEQDDAPPSSESAAVAKAPSARAPDAVPGSHVLAEAHKGFSTHQYKIRSVEFLDASGVPSRRFRFGTPLTVRVVYECLLPELPDSSCGLAVAVSSVPEYQAVMYFNTNYPHSDEEMLRYDDMEFRRYRGRRGVIDGRIPAVQLKPGEYVVSLGILPNMAEPHEFYEYHHLAYPIAVTPNGFPEPSVFYAQVEWSHRPSPGGDGV